MKVKEITIPEFKVGDKVNFIPELIKNAKNSVNDKRQVELFGKKLLEETSTAYSKTHVIEAITLNQMNRKSALIWLDGMKIGFGIKDLVKV